MPPRRAQRALFSLALLLSASRPARALDCAPPSGSSPCLDSNSLWLSPGASHFFALPSVGVPAGRAVAFAFTVGAQFGALELVVASPDPNGRSVPVVDRIVEHDLTLAVGLGAGLELGAVLPVIVHQRGAGSAALSSRDGAPLESVAVRDPRLSLGRSIALSETLGLKPLLRMSLPLGDVESHASAGRVTFAPAVPFEWRSGRWLAGLLVGLRLRPAVDLAAIRWGSQAEIAAGFSVDVLGHERLRLGLEGFLLPALADARSPRARRAGIHTTLIPAEWLGSVRLSRSAADPWSLTLGAGAGLALSTQTIAGDQARFLAPTSPGLRLLAEIRYAPRSSERGD